MLANAIAAVYLAGLVVFWGFYLIVVPYMLFHVLRPRTAKEKRHDDKLGAFIARWKDDPDFDSFTAERWFAWSVTCEEMGWFKS